MSILDHERNVVVAFAPLVHGDPVLWYDVCKSLKEGKTQEKIAEIFNTDDRTVRWIIKKKCPECSK